jgi:hypothetical protein
VALEDGDEFVIGGVLLTFRISHRTGDLGTSRSTSPLLPPLESDGG